MKRLILVPIFLVIVLVMVTPNTQAASGKHGLMAKVGFALASLYNEHRAYVVQKGSDKGFKPSNTLLPVIGNRVVIDAVARGNPDALKSDLKGLGLQKISRFGRVVSGQLPISAIKSMAALASLKFARPAYAMTRAGQVTSQGDAAMRSDVARETLEVNGAGVTVGVLSDSFNCLDGAATDEANDDLPSGILVLDDSGCPGTDEGRAMMQLIHDVAPGASQAFHTAFNGQADFAQGIQELADNGADVIVDDVIYFAEPMFQDGIIAQAVDNVVAGGVAYFSSAGNASHNSYQEPFFPSVFLWADFFIPLPGAPYFYGGYLHDFGGGNLSQEIIIPAGATMFIAYQWNDPFGSICGTTGCSGADTDMDIYLVDESLMFILAGGVDTNIGGDPVEIVGVVNSGTSDVLVNLIIVKYGGPDPELMKYVRIGGVLNLGQEGSGTIYGHANADGAEAVGAAFYGETPEFGWNPPLLESFSSAGPTEILFDTMGNSISEVRYKPEIVAPDGTDTTFFPTGGADIESNGFPNFFGTSAAAPHAAAVAALLLDSDPSLSPDDVYALLEKTALDMEDPGFDFDSGYGFIQADAAVAGTITPNVPPTVSSLSPTSGSTAGGDYVVIAGTYLAGATAVTFGGVDTSFMVNSSTQITAVAPPHAAGTVDVLVTTPDGTSANTEADDYTYVAPPAATMHVGDLDGITTSGRRGRWNATITITVHADGHTPVAEATVTGSWSAGAKGSSLCTTNSSGQCEVTKKNIKSKSNSVTFTVTDVTHVTNTYQSAYNHDPDGDSDGTSIKVSGP